MKVKSERYVTEGSFDAYVWQTLETKARFIQQVTTGHTAVRSAADLEGGALTYAEIKDIADARKTLEHLQADIATRDAHEGEEFTMAVGHQTFSGTGAREEAAGALAGAVLLRRDDYKLRKQASFRGFEIPEQGPARSVHA